MSYLRYFDAIESSQLTHEAELSACLRFRLDVKAVIHCGVAVCLMRTALESDRTCWSVKG